jgi:hypothetical protein
VTLQVKEMEQRDKLQITEREIWICVHKYSTYNEGNTVHLYWFPISGGLSSLPESLLQLSSWCHNFRYSNGDFFET